MLGGTFDPVHNAHLAMADAASHYLALDEIRFIPTGHTAYREPAHASTADRLEMLRLATAGKSRFSVDEREINGLVSGFTVDTLVSLRNEFDSDATLYLLIGADQARKFSTWREPERIKKLAHIKVFKRPGEPAPAEFDVIPMKSMAIAATDIRARAARGEDVSDVVPLAVANYIRERRVYH